MGNWKKHYSTEHLDATDIPDGRTVTVKIVRVGDVDLDGENGRERKMLVTFEPSEAFGKVCSKHTWAAAKTCGHCLAAMWGADDAAWIGKRVTLGVEQVDAFGDLVDAVRVKGSPDLQAPVTIRVKQGRKKVVIKLVPTATARAAAPPPPPPDEPGAQEVDGD